MIVKHFENSEVIIRIKDMCNGMYQAYSWTKGDMPDDYKIHEFETYGGACSYALDLIVANHSDLIEVET